METSCLGAENATSSFTKSCKSSLSTHILEPFDSFLGQFPIVKHTREVSNNHGQNGILSAESNKEYYDFLKERFGTVYPLLHNPESTPKDDFQILFLADLKYSEKQGAYLPVTPEDRDAFDSFMEHHNLILPNEQLSAIENIDAYSRCCIIVMSNDTIQLPLVINQTGEPVQETEESHFKSNDIRTLTILLYLGIILSVEDPAVRVRYLNSINESYLVENKVFEMLTRNKWNAFYKFLHLNHKNPFLFVSLKTWDALNFMFSKQNQLHQEIMLINAELYKKKELLKLNTEESTHILEDVHLKSLHECVENDTLLSHIRANLDVNIEVNIKA